MRLEVYPVTAKRLNAIIDESARRGVDRSEIWDRVIELARILAERDRNGGLVYPVHLHGSGRMGRYEPDRRHREIIRELAKLSKRDREEFYSRAALEVLDRERRSP